jgi:thioredoxin-like negative regulator of GroEL
VVDSSPKAPQPRLNLARIYAKAGRKSKAIEELELLEKLDANYAKQKDVAQMLKSFGGS